MNKAILLFLTVSILGISCDTYKSTTDEQDLGSIEELVTYMTGKFSSAAQARTDSMFYNISLVMYPIWENDSNAQWLYVEQAVAQNPRTPYRQRVYRVSTTVHKDLYESAVFTISNAEEFVHGWENPEVFQHLTPESLKVREGCSIYLTKMGNCYIGSTEKKECTSDFRGASYATSKVSICTNEVMSWDQGWNEADEQVWGAVKGGYVFKKESAF